MSLDAIYLLVYEVQSYVEPSPMTHDKALVLERCDGHCKIIELDGGYILFIDPIKYTLDNYLELDELRADQILERREGEDFKILK